MSVLAARIVGFQIDLVVEKCDAPQLNNGDAFVAAGSADVVKDLRQLGITDGERLQAGTDVDLVAVGAEGYGDQRARLGATLVKLFRKEPEQGTRVV
jgi:hypothetical protein